ncbi:uncharacterized protein CBL_09797 [Carabus blaptoides fortunei]
MDRDFMEKCRLLKQHFTKLTLADTETAQSRQETDIADDIINDAKKLLFYEQLDALSDQDIARLRQNSLLKYAKTLENYIPKGRKNKAYLTQPIRSFGSNLHTIPETQSENKENDEMWEETQMNLEEMKNIHEERKMKQQSTNALMKEQSEELFCTNIYANDELEDIMEQYEDYFQTSVQMTDKYYNKQRKMEDMKNDCAKYYNLRTKIDDEIEAMRRECSDMEVMMRNLHGKENRKIGKECKKVEKEVRFLEEPIQEKKEILEETDGTERRKEKVDAFKNIPELQIIPQPKTNIIQLLDIKKLQLENSDNQTFDPPLTNNEPLLKSTLTKWRNFAAVKKRDRAKSKTNTKKIENFLENLQKFKLSKSKSDLDAVEKHKNESISVKTKPKSSSSVETKVGSFEHRFKAQKDIIAMQKAKLAEQNKLIEELKLTRIQKEARESLEKAQNELQKTVQQSSKYKYRLKQPEPIIEEPADDPIGVAFSLNLSKAPKLVQLMEERAKEREDKRMLIKERKRLIEDEKKRLAEEAIERKTREESEEKQQRLERMKRQREMTRQMEMRRQWEKKRFITINQLACEHYKKKLMKNYGMKHFRMLVYNVKIKLEIGKRFYENNIIMRCYYSWKKRAQAIVAVKNDRAVSLCEYKMKLRATKGLKKVTACQDEILYEAVQRKQVAIDRYEMNLQSKVFIYWHRLICEYHIQYKINAQKAENHYKRILLFQCLHCWRSLPDVMKIQRLQNERKRKWRLRVAEILSDYDPLKCYDNTF